MFFTQKKNKMTQKIIQNEDHTLGNLLAKKLEKHPTVEFAAYSRPHPLENRIIIDWRVPDSKNPDKVWKETCDNLLEDLDSLLKSLV